MKILKDIIPEKMWSCGVVLDNLGVKEVAWDFFDVMKVIDILKQKRYTILGGDVYKMKDDKIEITYDNWYIDRNIATVENSIEKAEEYIEFYHQKQGEGYLYTLIIG